MKITNKLDLPRSFVEMAKSEYEYKDKQYSVTSIQRGLRETILKRRYHDQIESDVSDMIWMLFGQATHHILEQQEEQDFELKEEYLKVDVGDGYKLSGIFDLYDAKEKKIVDYKTSSVWKVIYEDYQKWNQQIRIYAWMMEQIGFEVDIGEVVAILKDHSKTKAKRKKNYPEHPVKRVKFSIFPKHLKETEKFIYDKFEKIKKLEKLPDSELPVCTKEERWRDDDKWAVKKKGNKRAYRVLDSEEEAKEWMENNKGNHIEYRTGTDKKCKDYCDVAEFCDYYQENVEVGAS